MKKTTVSNFFMARNASSVERNCELQTTPTSCGCSVGNKQGLDAWKRRPSFDRQPKTVLGAVVT
ncbi:MAG TPA: hypothetical protein PLF25_02785, partial [Accumulibacter sp.]|nr:hypothetical protein [Accumulibacter sp.]